MSAPSNEPASPSWAPGWAHVLRIGGVAAIVFSFCIDRQLSAWIATVQKPGLKSIALQLARLGEWPTLAGLAAVCFFAAAVGRSQRWMRLLALLFLTSLLAISVAYPLRIVTGRARPDASVAVAGWHGLTGKLLKGRDPYSSFPSSQAAVAFAMAAPLLIFARRRGIAAVIAAAVIGLSQVYLNVHFLSDVLAGATLGSICGVAVCRWRGLAHRLDSGIAALDRKLDPVASRLARLRRSADSPGMSVDAGLLGRFVFLLLCTAAAMVGALAIVKWGSPPWNVPEVTPKLAWLARHANEYNALLVGSSRIQDGIRPDVLDQAMEESGVSGIQSYNLGIGGMQLPELSYFFDSFWKLSRGNLKFIIIECTQLRSNLPPNGAYSTRNLYWHDLRRTMEICETLYDDPESREPFFGKRSDLCLAHLQLMIRNLVSLGRGAELLQAALDGDAAVEEGDRSGPIPSYVSRGRGYYRLAESMPPEMAARYRQELAPLTKAGSHPEQLNAVAQRTLRQFAAEVESVGAVPIFVIAPTTLPFTPPLPKTDSHSPPLLLDYSDPNRFPQLYAEENRHDPGHLNDSGAIVFTRILARSIAEDLKKRAELRRESQRD